MPVTASNPSNNRVNRLLQEIRIVLPGTQALLGFQFIAFFNSSFEKLTPSLQAYHLVNLLLVSCSTVLLIAPVAFQEILENGKRTERFLRFTSRMITAALFLLSISLAGDVFIAATFLDGEGYTGPVLIGGSVFLFTFLMWFGIYIFKQRVDPR